ncbi:uncharacterized protein LOC105159498 isoform X2 [Sesamum indicum]|uniref:Uncharacterized protein LOC105159498 isoform X2 n=1 Tax=Sesamum indicum TaxID=4182 RepID=A0A6I9SW69_SESIN|nr:uncharacterized protein LOC105159498 isoform X2 [Sesamum indicum]
MRNNKGVIINVYTESSRNLRPDRNIHPNKNINANLLSSNNNPRLGYDRRARLLAYAQELRHANAQDVERPFKNSTPRHKKRRWSLPAQKMIRVLLSRFDGVKRKWKYGSIVTEEYYSDPEGSSNQERMSSRKPRRRHDSHFCKRLRCFWKKISSVWQCQNGKC